MPGKNAPPMHPNCRCSASAYEDDAEYEAWLDFLDKGGTTEEWEARKSEMGAELQRRRIGSQGQEIIDKPTYNRLTKTFLKKGGTIIRGEEAERHLAKVGAYASYMVGANVAFIRDESTISDVLEEMFHAKQDREKHFGDSFDLEVQLRREIEAQKYLLSVAKKYKIPVKEVEVTQKNLSDYEKQLARLLKRGDE